MPKKYYPETDPQKEGNWVVVHQQPPIIVQVPVGLLIQGRGAVTAYLQDQGFAVTSDEDWHESLSMPDEP